MENKEEILKALDIAIKGYDGTEWFPYKKLFEDAMHLGVCNYLKKTAWVSADIVRRINDLGKTFILKHQKDLKKEFPLCFKKSSFGALERAYWCKLVPATAFSEEELKQSILFRVKVLKAIKIELEIL